MADIRIKDLATTASTTASDDFLAVDGTTNGTRKLSAATPSFATSVTVPGVVGPTSTDLTLTGGSTGASLVLGATTNGVATLKSLGTGRTVISSALGATTPTVAIYNDTPNTRTTLGIIGNGGSSQAVLQFGFGAAASPSLTSSIFTNTTDFQFNAIAGSNIAFMVGATEAARFAPTTGNLLIGTTTDAASLAGGLVVNGSGAGAAASSTTTGALRVTGGVGVSGAGYFGGAVTASSTAAGGFGQVSVTNNASAAINNYMLGSTYGGTTFGGVTGNNQAVIEASAAASSLYLGTGGGSSIVLAPNRTAALTLASGGAATFAGAVNVAGVLSGTGTNTWAMQSVGASGALVAGGWLYGINNGFNITPNGAGVAGATLMLAAFDGTGYREMLSTANVASGASTLRLAGYGGPTTVGGTLTVSGVTNVTNTTSASSSTVGALTIGNGTAATNVAIGGGNVNAGGTSTAAQFFTGTQGITSGVSSAFAVGVTNATTADVLSFGATARSGLLRGYHDGGGTITWQFGRYAGSFENWAELTGYSVATSGLKLYGTTPSTGSTSGALQVAGGIGVGGASVFEGKVSSNARFHASSSGGGFWAGAADLTLGFYDAAGSMVFRTSGINQLTLAATTGAATFAGTISPQQATTAGAPAYVKGAIYFDTTLNKLRVGGATAWETITSA